MKKLLITSILILSFFINPLKAQEKEIDLESLSLSSQNYILYSLDDDQVLDQKNSDVRLSAASINKVLTTITALDLLKDEDLDKEIIVYPEALYYLERDSSKAGLEANQVITLREVLYAIMLPSGADATAVMSLYLFNSQDGLVEAMNQKAREIKMNNTNIVNTAGLDDQNQYTTLEDLLKLIKYALQNEDFKEIYSKVTYDSHDGSLHFENPMLMMAQQNAQNYIVGAKSGYTKDAGRSLSSIGSDQEQSYIFISTQATGGPFEDNQAFLDANTVYNYLFSKTELPNSQTVSTDNHLGEVTSKTSFNLTNTLLNISTFIVLILIFLVIVACGLRMINIKKARKNKRFHPKS